MRLGSKCHQFQSGNIGFWCPGCEAPHVLRIRPAASPSWDFNGDGDAPTFQPSVLVTIRWSETDPTEKDEVCHSFVTAGRIQFLGDCTHALANQTVSLPDFPEDYQ